MPLQDTVAALRQWRRWLPSRRRIWSVGENEAADARRIADAEQMAGGVPDGCRWLDARTVADIDLPLVFRAIDRTSTPTGAQALWRWLAAPAVRLDVLTERERSLARLAADPTLRDRVRDALHGLANSDAPHLPRLLWEPPSRPYRTTVSAALAGAIGNDLELDASLLVTGSNMSGKSTFLRAIAINAICAQSIHTTFGSWTASLFRVFTVMRVADAAEEGMSTYAVEVAAIGKLVDAVARGDHELPALFVVDEPFSGTNPALRVPIVVSVLEYCGERDVVIAATHDLDVAVQVDARFARGYFAEADDESGRFDRTLRSGVAPGSNALALLARAGYPSAIVAAVERRVGEDARARGVRLL